jgi:uroporphyrinogen-III synthase
VTQAEGDNARLVELLTTAGFTPVLLPQIRFEAVAPAPPAPEGPFDLCILSSPRAARFARACWPAFPTCRRTLAIGPATLEAARTAGFAAELAQLPTLELMAEALPDAPPALKILMPRSDIADDPPLKILARKGHIVQAMRVYRTLPVEYTPEAVAKLRLDPPEAFVFTSPSTFKNFSALFGTEPLGGAVVAAIGPTTAAAISDAGVHVDCVPERPTAEELAASLGRCFHE